MAQRTWLLSSMFELSSRLLALAWLTCCCCSHWGRKLADEWYLSFLSLLPIFSDSSFQIKQFKRIITYRGKNRNRVSKTLEWEQSWAGLNKISNWKEISILGTQGLPGRNLCYNQRVPWEIRFKTIMVFSKACNWKTPTSSRKGTEWSWSWETDSSLRLNKAMLLQWRLPVIY